jgi:hypothetical protein
MRARPDADRRAPFDVHPEDEAAYRAYLAGALDDLEASWAPRPAGLSSSHISPRATLTYHEDANYARVGRPKGANSWKWLDEWGGADQAAAADPQQLTFGYVHPGGRGTVRQFSRRSRVRLLQRLASIAWRRLGYRPLFLTLTYPASWPSDERIWHRHLDSFRKALQRRWGKAGVFWRLELQRRGAPHFHLIWFGGLPETLIWEFRFWLSATWYRIVDSGDPKHLAAGTNATAVRSSNGAMFYAGKYTAKTGDEEGEYGRRWGVWCPELLPIVRVVVELLREGEMLARRVLARLCRRGRRREGARARRRRLAADEGRGPPWGYFGGKWAFASGDEMQRFAEFLQDIGWADAAE